VRLALSTSRALPFTMKGESHYLFNVGADTIEVDFLSTYPLEIRDANGDWLPVEEVQFVRYQYGSKRPKENNFSLTKQGGQFAIFATVLAIMERRIDWMREQKYSLRGFIFKANLAERSRLRLYSNPKFLTSARLKAESNFTMSREIPGYKIFLRLIVDFN
jgi:hypothetical protein